MSLHHPTVMHFGPARLISPDGSDAIPPDLWPELEALIRDDPEPPELAEWTRRLEDRLGVTAEHRRALRREPYSTSPPWNILRVSPNMERKVAAALGPKTAENPHGAGLTVYVPIEKYRPANTWRHRTRPLMSGYIFADLQDDAALDLARANHAVRAVMCKDGKPVKVPAVVIGTLILLEAWRAFDQTWKPSGARRNKRRGQRGSVAESRWKSGQRVKIAGGPFAGFVATVLRAEREDRIDLLVSVFGRETAMQLDEDMIEGDEG